MVKNNCLFSYLFNPRLEHLSVSRDLGLQKEFLIRGGADRGIYIEGCTYLNFFEKL